MSTKLKTKKNRPAIAINDNGLNRLQGWPLWISLILWVAISGLTTFSFQLAHWTAPQPIYIIILVISIALALINLRLRKPLWVTVLIFLGMGMIISIWQSVILFKAPAEYGLFKSMGYAFSAWKAALAQTSPNQNSIYFSLFLIVITWVWGYLGTWRLVKHNSVWPALFFGLIVILVNLDFLSKAYYGYFYTYIFLSIALISYTHFLRQNYHHGIFPKLAGRVPVWIAALILVFGGILILITGLSPEIKSDQLRTLIETKIKQSSGFQNLKINIFSAVSAKGTVVKSSEQDTLRFGHHPKLTDDIQFMITSSGVPNYWRDRRYDTYNSWGWSSSAYDSSIIESGQSQVLNVTPAEHSIVNYSVLNKIKTDVILSSGKYLSADVPSIIHYFQTSNPDITSNPDDNLVAVSTLHLYQVDDRYTVDSEIINPTIAQLKAAGSNYPDWIKNQYLQLPADLPASITRIDRGLMRRNGTEYDKVMAVTNYLSQFKYVLEGTYPPENKDAVEDFLTVQKAGNCTNFASAAVVLLRGAGIPARFCTGYIPHYVDKSRNTFVVLAKDYHAWPEIYFPAYGWIEFEVTPGSVANIVPDNTTNTLAGFSGASFNDFPLYFPVSPSLTQSSSTNPSSNLPPSRSSQAGLILLLIFLIIALIISLFMIWLRKNKRRDAISGIMARMYLISPLIGVPFRPYQTTQEYAMELSAKLPKHRREIEKLTQIYLISRYSHSKQVIITDIFLLNEYWRSLFWGMLKLIIFRS